MASYFQHLRSLRHGFWLALSERIGWSRGTHRETAALQLRPADPEQAERIAALQRRYQVRFEAMLGSTTSLCNYEYLDILDRAWTAAALPRRQGGTLVDVGCANFWYAACLQEFFRPEELVGVEVEGHRLYRDGRTRLDYARGYLAALPHARLELVDYRSCNLPADVITAWFPFLTPAAILAWRLPLRLLRPAALFARIAANLKPGGLFIMVNHGRDEAALAESCCIAAGLHPLGGQGEWGVFSTYRAAVPVLSAWARL